MLPTSFWVRYIGWVRVALAAAALLLSFLIPASDGAIFRAVVGAFLVYTLLLAFRVKGLTGRLGVLALLADAGFFLLVASFGSARLLWIASVFFLYLLTEA